VAGQDAFPSSFFFTLSHFINAPADWTPTIQLHQGPFDTAVVPPKPNTADDPSLESGLFICLPTRRECL
jgi:hypothetical protein